MNTKTTTSVWTYSGRILSCDLYRESGENDVYSYDVALGDIVFRSCTFLWWYEHADPSEINGGSPFEIVRGFLMRLFRSWEDQVVETMRDSFLLCNSGSQTIDGIWLEFTNGSCLARACSTRDVAGFSASPLSLQKKLSKEPELLVIEDLEAEQFKTSHFKDDLQELVGRLSFRGK